MRAELDRQSRQPPRPRCCWQGKTLRRPQDGCPSNDPWPATPDMSGNPGTGTRKRTHWLPDGKTDRSAVANVGYARVSTLDQDFSLQLDALAAVGCGKVFEDRASGARADRAGLQAALARLRAGRRGAGRLEVGPAWALA